MSEKGKQPDFNTSGNGSSVETHRADDHSVGNTTPEEKSLLATGRYISWLGNQIKWYRHR
jgi:hypothetical protein